MRRTKKKSFKRRKEVDKIIISEYIKGGGKL
jgi:hypothetical protein